METHPYSLRAMNIVAIDVISTVTTTTGVSSSSVAAFGGGSCCIAAMAELPLFENTLQTSVSFFNQFF